MKCLLRTTTKPFFFVRAVHGVCYVTYVPEQDGSEALEFDQSNAKDWIKLLNDPDKGLELEMVDLKGKAFAGEIAEYKLRQENSKVFKKYSSLESVAEHVLVGVCPICKKIKYLCPAEPTATDRTEIEDIWVRNRLEANIYKQDDVPMAVWCSCVSSGESK